MMYDTIDDELKRLTNRCVAKMLTELDHLHNSDKIILKNAIRHFERSIRNNILNDKKELQHVNSQQST